MMSCFRLALALVFPIMMSGCGSLGAKATLIDRDGFDIVMDHANGTGFILSGKGARERVCRAPSPDALAGDGASANLALPSTVEGSVASAGINGSFNAVSLGGRSPSVLIARELMYRACEVTTNLDLSKEETLAVYERFLGEVERIARNTAGPPSSPMQFPTGQKGGAGR